MQRRQFPLCGHNRHQDSYGHDAVVHAGDLAWMQAGKGIVHAEGMNENKQEPELVHGLQLWISLPAKDKFREPAFYFYPSSDLPVFNKEGATIKVICGQLQGQVSPVKSLSPAFIYEVTMPAGNELNLPFSVGDTCGVYVIAGQIFAGNQVLEPTVITQFDAANNNLQLKATMDRHLIIFGGTPLKEPVVAYASYVMNTKEQIQQLMNDYQHGKMGTVKL